MSVTVVVVSVITFSTKGMTYIFKFLYEKMEIDRPFQYMFYLFFQSKFAYFFSLESLHDNLLLWYDF